MVFWWAGFVAQHDTVLVHNPIESTLYEEVYKPFVLVSVDQGDGVELRRGSGFLIKHVENGECHILAVTNHHVVYGEAAMTAEENVPDLHAIIIITLALKEGETVPEMHLADPLRTSKYADLSLLYIPKMSCDTTATAELADNNRLVRVLENVLHATASGAEQGNIEIIPGQITRFGVDIAGHVTFSTNVMIVSGMSGSPVFLKTLRGYQVVGVVKSHYTLDGVNNAGTNYIAPPEELRILIGK